MALDPSIILRGQPLDVVGAMRQGNAAAAEVNALRTQNQVADLYRTQGADILAGNQGALNALAGFDPMAAMDIQAKRQDMTYRNRQLEVLNAEEARAIETFKAQASAADAAAAAAQIEDAVRMGMAIQTPEQWDMVMSQQAPQLVGQFANRDVLAQKYMTMAEILKQQNQTDRYRVVGNQVIDLLAEGGPRAVIEAPGQTETIYGPDGTPIVTRGPTRPFTEAQDKSNIYATRAEGALQKLEPVANELAGLQDTALGAVPFGLGRYAQSEGFQVAKQAGDEFLQAILRKDTGAAITADEQVLYGDTLLPRPGDSPAVLEAKRQSRARAIEAMKSGMNADQIIAAEKALVEAAKRTAQPPSGQPAAVQQPAAQPQNMTADSIATADIDALLSLSDAQIEALTPEEQAALLQRLNEFNGGGQ